jgi:hypothetical protein
MHTRTESISRRITTRLAPRSPSAANQQDPPPTGPRLRAGPPSALLPAAVRAARRLAPRGDRSSGGASDPPRGVLAVMEWWEWGCGMEALHLYPRTNPL